MFSKKNKENLIDEEIIVIDEVINNKDDLDSFLKKEEERAIYPIKLVDGKIDFFNGDENEIIDLFNEVIESFKLTNFPESLAKKTSVYTIKLLKQTVKDPTLSDFNKVLSNSDYGDELIDHLTSNYPSDSNKEMIDFFKYDYYQGLYHLKSKSENKYPTKTYSILEIFREKITEIEWLSV